MKKNIFIILSLFFLLLISCNNDIYYQVTLTSDGYVAYQNIKEYDYAKEDIPSKEGYSFGGWYKDQTFTLPFDFLENKITNDITIFGKWIPNKYEVTIHYNNGSPDLNLNIEYNSHINIENPLYDGYEFVGWYTDNNFTNSFDITNDVVKSKLNLYAKWSLSPFEIKFIVDDDISVVYVEENETCNQPENPYKDGYNFLGWYLNDILFDFDTKINTNIELYAKFERNLFDYTTLDSDTKELLTADGFLDGKITDFNSYLNTDAYRIVSTPLEFIKALSDAKYTYNNIWDEETLSVKQELIEEGKVHVIEIVNDLNLGYNILTSEVKNYNIISDYKTNGALSDMVLENGISQIKIENTSNLLIYSKNGSKLTHAGFKLTSCHNVVFRNLAMDELWEWEDSLNKDTNKIGDYDKFGWAYFKISHCGQIWIDHMEFGKSYDGQIDYSNPVSNSKSTKLRLAYGSDGSNGLHISYCLFKSGSDDKDGYLYKMMDKMEKLYVEGSSPYLYYNALRDGGLTFDEILYGIAIPQKKGFLFGDNSNSNDDFYYNKEMKVSFNSCRIINFCDRIPKVRGGQVYMYNTVIDSLDYMDYRARVYSSGTGLVSKVNSSWKCAAVSQGFLVSYGGYLHIENSMIKGVSTIIKNNDSKTDPFVDNIGYYNFINVLYQSEKSKNSVTGSTVSNVLIQFDKQTDNLKISKLWPYYDGIAPFVPNLIELDNLNNHLENLDYGVGIKKHVTSWLISNLNRVEGK